MKRISIAFVFTLLTTFISAQIYVSPQGNDNNDGSINSPLATVQAALNLAQAGDTIYLREGIYNERVYFPASGQEGKPIVLTGYNKEKAIIDGTNATNSTQNALIALYNISNVVISNLTLRNNIRQDASAIYYQGAGSGITVENCDIYNIGWTDDASATATSSDNAHAIVFVGTQATAISSLRISGNYIHNCITGYSEALTLVGNIDSFFIEYNRLDSITNIGIDVAGHWSWTGAPADVNFSRNGVIRWNTVSRCISPYAVSAGIYSDGAQDIIIENNTLLGNRIGISVGIENSDTVSNIKVLNNLCFNNLDAGIYFGGSFANTGVVINSLVSGNTLYHNDLSYSLNDWTGELILNRNSDCQIINNIIIPRSANNKKALIAINDGTNNLIVDYCLLWREDGDVTNLYDWGTGNTYTVGNNIITQDPLLVDPSNSDFHLTQNSPAINAGDPDYLPINDETDIDGDPRIIDERIDMGADEFGGEITAVLNPLNLRIYPNPAQSYIIIENAPENTVLQVMDLHGEVIKTIQVKGRTQKLDLNGLQPGVYFLRFEQNSRQGTIFIKQ